MMAIIDDDFDQRDAAVTGDAMSLRRAGEPRLWPEWKKDYAPAICCRLCATEALGAGFDGVPHGRSWSSRCHAVGRSVGRPIGPPAVTFRL